MAWSAAPAKPAASPSVDNVSKVVALVNNEEITREQLADECVQHYGREVLDGMIHRHLIGQECKRLEINITAADVDNEIDRMASRFGLPVEQWLKMLKQERGINPRQYATDIVWPMLALRRLAGERLQISTEDLNKEYETQFGPAVKTRMIVCNTEADAQQVRKMALANPESFGNLAKEHSRDPSTASMKGLTPPIHRHLGHPEIERVAFAMKDGEISEPIKAGPQFVILKREQLIPPSDVKPEDARPRLEEIIRDRKQRAVAGDVFQQMEKQAKIDVLFGDQAKSQQLPGVAAVVNGHQITNGALAIACIERHGDNVLEGMINRRLLEQACRKSNVTVSDQEMNAEVARVASLNLRPKADGSPDIETWHKIVTEQKGISLQVYYRDSVWPSVALRKLVADKVMVSEDDLRKGFEANYGPRVRCRAIVLASPRAAQKVWEQARQNPSVENFGKLAAQYSIEAGSRALEGEVPPIRKNGGQPLLEKEAFALRPGELSGIIQAGDKYIILLCEGLTAPVQVDPNSVRDLLAEDIREKKTHLAMGECFEQLQDNATIDNVLAGTSRSPRNKQVSPQRPEPPQDTARRPAGGPPPR
jgi:parvulin-like peptidyl-prolyl isomerase